MLVQRLANETCQRKSAVTMQRLARGMFAKKQLKELKQQENEARKQLNAVVSIQSRQRGVLQQKEYRRVCAEKEKEQLEAATVIQSYHRKAAAQKVVVQRQIEEAQQQEDILHQEKATVIIQTRQRGMLQQREYHRVRAEKEALDSVISIQSCRRGVVARRDLEKT
jgi:hypothetical protein